MTFTGSLIEDLIATVERVQRVASSDEPLFAEPAVAEPLLMDPLLVQPWLASIQENTDYDSKFIGVA
jgi:hypothetical protein